MGRAMTDAPESYELEVSFIITQELSEHDKQQWRENYGNRDDAADELKQETENYLMKAHSQTEVEDVSVDVDIEYDNDEDNSETSSLIAKIVRLSQND
jgi:hypothetical protein